MYLGIFFNVSNTVAHKRLKNTALENRAAESCRNAAERHSETLQHRPGAAGMAAEISGADGTPPTYPPHWLHTRERWEIHRSARQPSPARDRLSRVTITPEQTVSRKKGSVPRSVEKFCPSNMWRCKMTQLSCSRPTPPPVQHSSDAGNTTQSCKFGGL